MSWRFWSSLRFQIALAVSVLVITAVALLGFLVIYLTQNVVTQEKQRLGLSAATVIQRALSRPSPAEAAAGEEGFKQLAQRVSLAYFDSRYDHSLTFFDNGFDVIWSTLDRERWPYAKVFSRDAQFFVRDPQVFETSDPASGQSVMVVLMPWKVSGIQVGVVQFIQPMIPSQLRFLFSGKLVIAFAVVYAVIVILLGVMLLNQTVIQPVERLTDAVSRVMEGERHIDLPGDRDNELGVLARNISKLAKQLGENEASQGEQIEELLSVNEELELTRRGLIRSEKLASVGRLAAGVAHEVGNPLAAILGYVDLLRKGGLDAETEADFLERIEKDVSRINNIIRGLLDYSRPQRVDIKKLDLNAVVIETIDLFRPQKQFKNITFDFTSHQHPAFVRADAHQLQQVLVNLFLNASHAMNEEGAITVFLERVQFDPSVTYRHTADKFTAGQSLITCAVIDQGKGMSEEVQERIFDPFFTTKEPGSGTGLGLSVGDKIIDSFGGALTVTSQTGEGATFTLLLPEHEDETPDEDASEAGESVANQEEDIPELIG